MTTPDPPTTEDLPLLIIRLWPSRSDVTRFQIEAPLAEGASFDPEWLRAALNGCVDRLVSDPPDGVTFPENPT